MSLWPDFTIRFDPDAWHRTRQQLQDLADRFRSAFERITRSVGFRDVERRIQELADFNRQLREESKKKLLMQVWAAQRFEVRRPKRHLPVQRPPNAPRRQRRSASLSSSYRVVMP